jgi:hypothetical protein
MATPSEHRRHLAGLQSLYGAGGQPVRLHRPRTPHAALRELQIGARSLADLVESWDQLPAAGDLAGVRATLAGLSRVAAELAGGPHDAA